MKQGMLLLAVVCMAIMMAFHPADDPEFEKGTMTDKRTGVEYKTVRIGNQWWMAENLQFTGLLKKDQDYACVDKDDDLCQNYGKLYTYGAIKTRKKMKEGHRSICPKGWHLPSKEEWMRMVRMVNNYKVISVRLINKGGDTGLDLTLSGNLNDNTGKSQDVDRVGYYWTSSTGENDNPMVFYIWSNTDYDTKAYDPNMHALCRCVKN